MRSCKEFEPLISAFLDGELSEADRAETAAHLAACPACQKYYDDLVAIHDALEQMEEAPVPEGFAGTVMARVRATPQEREESRVIVLPRWRRWAALAACCALVALGVWRVRSYGGDMREAKQTVMARSAPAAVQDAGTAPAEEDACMPTALMDEAAEEETAREAQKQTGSGGDTDNKAEPAAAPAAPAPEDDCTEDTADETPVCAYTQDACDPEEDRRDCAAGTVVAGGEAARAWVENELGLAWEPGRTYPLTEEEFAALLEALTAAGEDFRQEPGETCQLLAE